jgi:adenine phosphoribosyltransferase
MNLEQYIRNIPDFPKPGIQFKDITTLLQNGPAFQHVINKWKERYEGQKIDAIVGAEARGLIFGAALAYALGVSFVPVRKPGKLPSKTLGVKYELEYGTDSLEVHSDAIKQGDRVVLVDDLLATGGTMEAVVKMMNDMQAEIVDILFLVELTPLKGRDKLLPHSVHALIEYDEL